MNIICCNIQELCVLCLQQTHEHVSWFSNMLHSALAHFPCFRENIFLVLMFRHSVGTIAALLSIISTWHWYSRGINPVVSEGNLPFRKLAHLHHGPGGVCVLIDALTPMTPIYFYSSSSSVSLYYYLHNDTFTYYCQASSCLKMD